MQDPETSLVFAGIDGRSECDIPEWYRQQQDPDELLSFAEAIRTLPQAAETKVAYRNPYTDEWVETDRFNAVVEPSRLAAQSTDEEAADPLFNVPTESYSIINPTDVYAPLEDVLRETTIDDQPLGDVVFGEIRQYRGGGEVHMDVLFDGLAVTLPGRNDPITMGVTSGYDFFGGHAVYVEGFAQDTYCANSMRALTDRKVVKHVGDVGDFGVWWEEILGQLELVADDLVGFIEDAQDIELEFSALPFGVEEFYELLCFPTYLAERAAEDARANATDPFVIDMWTMHSGATYALSHFYRGKEGSALDRYVRTANDILFNPDEILDRVKHEYKEQAESETGTDGQTGLESQVALAQLEQAGEDVQEKAETFEEREELLRERLAEVSD